MSSRKRAVFDAAQYGANYVERKLLTKAQLDDALDAVAAGANFVHYILQKEWVTEEEIQCVDRGMDTCECDGTVCSGKGNGRTPLQKLAVVSVNRARAHHDAFGQACDDFQSFTASLAAQIGADE